MDSKFITNPIISKFTLQSKFIYDLDEYKVYLDSVKNANLLKPNQIYIDNIKELINIINLNKDANSQKLFIKIRPEIFKKLVQYSTIKFIESPLEIFKKNKFQFEKNRSNLTCRKLADAYYKSTGIKTNRQTVCNIIKKKLGYRYRKTTVKNNKINSDKNIFIFCAFLKIITRSIKIGFKVGY